jgi:predicted RNA-binding protein
MAQYWILCMSEDNYEIARKQGLIGMAERQRRAIQKLATGDMLTFYVSQKTVDSPPNDPAHKVQQFRGIARITGGL